MLWVSFTNDLFCFIAHSDMLTLMQLSLEGKKISFILILFTNTEMCNTIAVSIYKLNLRVKCYRLRGHEMHLSPNTTIRSIFIHLFHLKSAYSFCHWTKPMLHIYENEVTSNVQKIMDFTHKVNSLIWYFAEFVQKMVILTTHIVKK